MAIYVAIVEAEGAGKVQPLWTSRDPELLRILRDQICKRLTIKREQREQAGIKAEGHNRG